MSVNVLMDIMKTLAQVYVNFAMKLVSLALDKEKTSAKVVKMISICIKGSVSKYVLSYILDLMGYV